MQTGKLEDVAPLLSSLKIRHEKRVTIIQNKRVQYNDLLNADSMCKIKWWFIILHAGTML